MPLYQGTTYALNNEPCIGLYELNFKTPDQRERHRYQIIVVVRNDKPAEFRKDLGKAKKYKHDQFRIPGSVFNEKTGKTDILHTVGELKDIADQMRLHKWDKKELVGVNRIKE